MALNEYRPGTAFPGVIGRAFDQSSPAWPQPLRAREGRRMCCSSSWTTPGSGSWAATGVDADDAVAACDQFARQEAGAAAEIEHRAHTLRVGTPELMEEGGPAVVDGVDDDLVVDPGEPRVRLDVLHSASASGQIPRILALAAANSSSVRTPWVCSAASFWSCAVALSSASGASGAYCCGSWAYCCGCCWSYLAA